MRQTAGKSFGPYQIVGPLGAGGMATVYRAYQPGMDRFVALKVLPPAYALDPKFVERFRREARTIARLEHPHIVPVYDFGESDGSLYLAMRLFDSGTLLDRLKEGPLAAADYRWVVTQVADALDYAHSQGVIHRDLKPSNVLIDRRGDCFLSDFGIAKLLEASAFTSSGGLLGTPQYVSPEQVSGQPVDHRADLYALGVMLYEMVTGRLPFEADTPMVLALKHAQEPPLPPRSLNPDIAPALETVILKALAKNPDERYQSGEDLAQAVEGVVTKEEIVHFDSAGVFDERLGPPLGGTFIRRASGPTARLYAPKPLPATAAPEAGPVAPLAAVPPTAFPGVVATVAEPATMPPQAGPVTPPIARARAPRRQILILAGAGGLAVCGLIAAAAVGLGVWGQLGGRPAAQVSQGDSQPTAEVLAEAPTVEDDFGDNNWGWALVEGSDTSSVDLDSATGELVLRTGEQYGLAVAAAADMPEFADAAASVETYVGEGSDFKYGLACRLQPDSLSGYIFLIRYTNLLYIARWDDGQPIDAADVESSAFVADVGQNNDLSIACVGSDLSLSVNGTQVYQFSDSTYSSGKVALFVESLGEAPVEIRFDNFSVTAP